MRWNLICGSLVLAMGVCTQGHSFELLDRMLGAGGCCSSGVEASCGAAAVGCNACGAAAAPSCGCASEPSCGAASACGCDAAPSCGCGKKKHCGGLLGNLFARRHCNKCDAGCDSGCAAEPACSCAAAAPSCGCASEPSCGCESADSACGCGKKKHCGGLLGNLFARRSCGCKATCDSGCEAAPSCGCAAVEPSCGCSACGAAPVMNYSAPGNSPAPAAVEHQDSMPPAPIVDPSAARLPKSRVIKATYKSASFGRTSNR